MLIEFKEYEGHGEDETIILINKFEVCVVRADYFSGDMSLQTHIYYQNGFATVKETPEEVRGKLFNLKLIEFQDNETNKLILFNPIKISSIVKICFKDHADKWTDIITMNGFTYAVTETIEEVRNKIEGK